MISKIKSSLIYLKKIDINRECEVLPKNKFKKMLDFYLVLYLHLNS